MELFHTSCTIWKTVKKKNSGPGKMPELLLRKYNYRIKSNSYTYKLANS